MERGLAKKKSGDWDDWLKLVHTVSIEAIDTTEAARQPGWQADCLYVHLLFWIMNATRRS